MTVTQIPKWSFENIYALLLALALSLHIFNMGGTSSLKPFHIAAFAASLMTLFYSKKKRAFYHLLIFLFCVAISALISPAVGVFSGFINLLIVTLCCYGVSIANIETILKCLCILIPADLLVLVYIAISEPTYRFQGLYNDPNYLCTTLLVFLFICIQGYLRFQNKIIKATFIVSISIIVFLILITLSRTGMACTILILCVTSINFIRKHLLKFVFIAFIAIAAVNYYASDFINTEFSLIYERVFEASDNLESAGEHRSELSKQNLRYIADNPQFIFWGLGPGTTDGEVAKQIPNLSSYRGNYSRDHNTWTSCVSEYGIIAFVFFLLIVLGTLKALFRNEGLLKYASIGFCISLLIFSFSIWQMTYLPFWWGLFLLNNRQLQII